jgi:hypothetical protein
MTYNYLVVQKWLIDRVQATAKAPLRARSPKVSIDAAMAAFETQVRSGGVIALAERKLYSG